MKSPKPQPLHCFMKLQHKSQRIKMAQREREERKKTGTFFDRLEIDQNFDMLPFRSGIFQSPVLVKFGETQSSHIINAGWNLHLTRLYVEQFSARNSNSCCELHERFQINSVWGTYVCVHFERYTFFPPNVWKFLCYTSITSKMLFVLQFSWKTFLPCHRLVTRMCH